MPDWEGWYRRAHFYAGNAYRLASIPWRQKEIAMGEATSIFACSFGDQGWHHVRETLKEIDTNPDIPCTATTLYRYLKNFRPGGICDLISPQPKIGTGLAPFVYPWGTFRIGEINTAKDPWTSRFCGPSSDAFAAEEFERIKQLYGKLKAEGYQPWDYGHTFVGGTFLVAEDGRRRFVVLQGNHRLAVFAHLGYSRIKVRNVPGFLPGVAESGLMAWPLVIGGRCDPTLARQIFRLFFEQDGHHVLAILSREAAAAGGRG